MNYNKSVVTFIIVTTLLLLGYSIISIKFPQYRFGLENINLLSDIIKTDGKNSSSDNKEDEDLSNELQQYDTTVGSNARDISLYNHPGIITSFNVDTSMPGLPALMQKLSTIKHYKKGKVRIAWLGDSMIEGDLLTQTVRKRLQAFFGGSGVGFVTATSLSAPYRTTVTHKWTGEWKEQNFKTKPLTEAIYISGHVFNTDNGSIKLKDNTGTDSTQLYKYLFCGPLAQFNIAVNGLSTTYNAPNKFNKILLEKSNSRSIEVSVNTSTLPVYGISLETNTGIIIDNLSFRGITGIELKNLDISLLESIQKEAQYDLIILEYGANLMFKPNDADYSWFEKNIIPVVKRVKEHLPNAEMLIISTSDRAFKYEDGWKTAVGIDNLLKMQAKMAYVNNTAFFNMYTSMGGRGTIVKWADSTPLLANKDYIHPNHKGAEILGNIFADAFIRDYYKYENTNRSSGSYISTPVGTIIDSVNHLEWLMGENKHYNWDDAVKWAKNSTTSGGGWRLPTSSEAQTLYHKGWQAGEGFAKDGKTYKAAICPLFTNIGNTAWIWTSSSENAEKAISVNLYNGVITKSLKQNNTYPLRAFAVRNLNK